MKSPGVDFSRGFLALTLLFSAPLAVRAASAPCGSDSGFRCHDFDYELDGPGVNGSLTGTHLVSLPLIIDDTDLPAFTDLSMHESMPCDQFESFLDAAAGTAGSVVSQYSAVADSFTSCSCPGTCNFEVEEGGAYLMRVPVAAAVTFLITGRDEAVEAVLRGPAHGAVGRNMLRVPHGMLKHEHEKASELVADIGGFTPVGPVVSISHWVSATDSFVTLTGGGGTDFFLDSQTEPRAAYLIVMDRDLAYTPDYANRHCTINNGANECNLGLDCDWCFDDADCADPNEVCHVDVGEPEDSSVHFQNQHLHAEHGVIPEDHIRLRVETDDQLHIHELNNGGVVTITAPTVLGPSGTFQDGHSDWIDLGGIKINGLADQASVTMIADFVDSNQSVFLAATERPRLTIQRIFPSGDFQFEMTPDYSATTYGVTRFRIEARHCARPRGACPNGSPPVASYDCTLNLPTQTCKVQSTHLPSEQRISRSIWGGAVGAGVVKLPDGTMTTGADKVNTVWMIPMNGAAIVEPQDTKTGRKSLSITCPVADSSCIKDRSKLCSEGPFTDCGITADCYYCEDGDDENLPCSVDGDCAGSMCNMDATCDVTSSLKAGGSHGPVPTGPVLVLEDVFFGGGVCGDAVLEIWEDCDDGNKSNGDTCPAACLFVPGPAGAVPDGGSGTDPIGVTRLAGDDVELSWARSCKETDADYGIYEGTLGSFASHTAKLCGTGGETSVTVTSPVAPSSGVYYLVVALSADQEGSYGLDGDGFERPAGVATCMPQSIGTCP